MSEPIPDSPDHDWTNPDPWLALTVDQSTFFDHSAQEALITNNRTWSRRILLPIIRPFARLSIGFFRFIRLFIPDTFTSPRLLHKMICWGMTYFVSPEANLLILRHFNLGSQVLQFLNMNLAEGKLSSHPLLPHTIWALADNVFVQHDLNIYNFIIALNRHLQAHHQEIQPRPLEEMDFSAIQDFEHHFERFPRTWHNILDLQSAIELYTPLFALLLSREDFERASNSLQLDETIAIYVATLFQAFELLGMVNNKHPMVPLSTVESGFRLMMHGFDAENLYGFIKRQARRRSVEQTRGSGANTSL